MCDPLLLLCRALLEREQPALDEIEFLKGKPPTRRAQFLLPLWEVNPSKGIRTSDEPMPISSIVPSKEKYFHYENA